MEELFDEKAVQGLDYLLHHFWVLRKEEPAMYQLIRERQKVLQRYVSDKLGLQLHVRQHFIKLEKVPITPERWMGIQDFQTSMDYMIFCYALAFIEGKSIEEQFLLSELCEEIRAISYEQVELDWTLYQHRKSLIRVMKVLVDLHLIETIDGDVQRFDHHEEQEVLYEVTIYSRYFMRVHPEEFTAFDNAQQLLALEHTYTNEDERRKRVYRQLFTTPAIYRKDGQDQDFAYIRNYRNRISDDIEKHSDLKLHVFKNVAFLSVTEPKKYYELFPNTKSLTDIMLQLSRYFHDHLEEYSPRENGDIVLTEGQLNGVLEEIREQFGEGWAKLYREKSIASVRQEVVEELINWRMASVEDRFVHIHALLGVLAGKYPTDYKKEGSEQYITTGIGMQARRHKDLKSWYFIITDNRRIGLDFDLAHRNKTEIIPFSQKELQHRIDVGGVVTNSQKEYAELVNKYIFGFEKMDAYEDLVKLLIQLRAPKLSKDFKPTVIYEILESALPPLTDDELRHLSDTIESMDHTQQQLEQLTLEYEANKKIVKRYNTYNEYILAERAGRVVKAEERLAEAEAKKAEHTRALTQATEDAEKLAEEQVHVKLRLEVAEKERISLSKHKVWDLQEKLKENESLLTNTLTNIEKQQKRKDDGERKRIRLLDDIRQQQDELAVKEAEQREILKEMQALATDADFVAHELNVESLARHSVQFDYWEQEIESHKDKLRQVKKLVSEQNLLQAKDKELERKSSEMSKEIDIKQKELDQAAHWFDEELHKLKTSIFTWMKQYEQLHYSVEEQQQISHLLEQLYEKSAYHEAMNILMDGLNSYRADLKTGLKDNENGQKKIRDDIALQQEQLEKLHSEELAEPERMPGTLEFRKQLEAQHIPFVPFYAAVEFQSHVTDEQKARLEAVLETTGVLDSLISPKTLDVQEDAQFIPNGQLLGYTLADFLQPDVAVEGISSELVDEILRSIPVDEVDGSFTVDEKGFYRLGILKGHAPEQGPSKFIGRTSRKRYQQEQIVAVQAKIEQLKDDFLQLQQQYANINEAYEATKQWEVEIPSDKALHDIYFEIQGTATEQRILKEELKKIDADWNEVRHALKAVRQQLHEAQDVLNIAQTKAAINEALQFMDTYLQELNKLRRTLLEQGNARTRVGDLQYQLEELEYAIEEYHGEIIDLQNDEAKLEAEMASQKQQLQLEGAEEIRQIIVQLQDELERLRKRDDQIRTDLPSKQSEKKSITDELQRTIEEMNFALFLLEQWQRALQDELDLGFVQVKSHIPKDILAEYKEKLQQDRAKLQENLTKVINEEMNALAEYHISSYLKETDMIEEFLDIQDDRLEAFIQLRGRRIVELEYRGQKVSPYTIDKALQAELEENRHYLDEQDRELYEDIIVNSVGRILRQRIARAEQWVKQMDKIMSERDNSSGLIFSVSWKPRTAEAEDELDTKELVQLLQRKSNFLSDDDLQKITKHFRSRIESAKETIGLRNEGNTLHQVLKEVLDYRKWFSFVLSYTRQNETKKELTNNAFYKFSGGEKAMAMYIPLFTAAFSRYKEADEMAPYIISLDEAFAGVDEQNIRDMFEVVEQLGFNYIMNSQVIWGDYDTVSGLAISELVRPKNADFVTVLNYTWNGKERVLNE